MRHYFNQHPLTTAFILMTIELLILAGCAWIGLESHYLFPNNQSWAIVLPQGLAICLSLLFALALFGAYNIDFTDDFRYEFLRVTGSIVLGFGIISLLHLFFPKLTLSRDALVNALIAATLGILTTRYILHKYRVRHRINTRVWILGAGKLAQECHTLVHRQFHSHHVQIEGFIALPNEQIEVRDVAVYPLEGPLQEMIKKHEIREIVVAVNNRRGQHFPIEELLDCKLQGVRISDISAFFEREADQIRINLLQPGWLVFGDGFNQGFLRTSMKRDFDLAASLVLLLVSLPAMIFTACCIWLEGLLRNDRGPVFYQQERVGLNGSTFNVIKFRSMRMDAEKSGKPQWSTENDPRVTKVGRIIRKFRIDELPQIINVFKGEMSFVGPRPERPYFVKQLCEEIPYYNLRHSVKPGITGWAQVRYQYGASVDDALEKLQYDLYYVKNHSLLLDMLVLIETVQVVLGGKGAR